MVLQTFLEDLHHWATDYDLIKMDILIYEKILFYGMYVS